MCGIARAIIYIILHRRKKFYLKLCRNRHFVYFKGGDLLACTACSGEEARGAGPAAGPVGADADAGGPARLFQRPGEKEAGVRRPGTLPAQYALFL